MYTSLDTCMCTLPIRMPIHMPIHMSTHMSIHMSSHKSIRSQNRYMKDGHETIFYASLGVPFFFISGARVAIFVCGSEL